MCNDFGIPHLVVYGDGSIVRLVAMIDEDEINNVPTRIYKYGTLILDFPI